MTCGVELVICDVKRGISRNGESNREPVHGQLVQRVFEEIQHQLEGDD